MKEERPVRGRCDFCPSLREYTLGELNFHCGVLNLPLVYYDGSIAMCEAAYIQADMEFPGRDAISKMIREDEEDENT